MDLKELVKNNVKFNGKSIKDITPKQPDVEKSKFSIEISKIEIKDINDCKNDLEKAKVYEHNFNALDKLDKLVKNKDEYSATDNEAEILSDSKLKEIADKTNVEFDKDYTFEANFKKVVDNMIENIVELREKLKKEVEEEKIKEEINNNDIQKEEEETAKQSKCYTLHNSQINDKFDDIMVFIEGDTLEFTLDSGNMEKFYNLRFQTKEDLIPDVVTARIDEFVSEYDGKKRCDMGTILNEIPHIFKANGVPLQQVDFDINGVSSKNLSNHIGMITNGLKECNATYYNLNINEPNKDFSKVKLNNTTIDIDDKVSNVKIYYNADTKVKTGNYIPTVLISECLAVNKSLKDKMMSPAKTKDDIDK